MLRPSCGPRAVTLRFIPWYRVAILRGGIDRSVLRCRWRGLSRIGLSLPSVARMSYPLRCAAASVSRSHTRSTSPTRTSLRPPRAPAGRRVGVANEPSTLHPLYLSSLLAVCGELECASQESSRDSSLMCDVTRVHARVTDSGVWTLCPLRPSHTQSNEGLRLAPDPGAERRTWT